MADQQQERRAPFVKIVAKHRPLVTSVVSILLVTSTALVGLVIEDVLPNNDQDVINTAGTTWIRLVTLIAAVLSAALVVWFLARSREKYGTLYYFRLLDDHSPDIHESVLREAEKNFQDFRAVTRTVSLPTSPCVDVVGQFEQARARLQIAANEDTTDTAFTLAPNAYWPMLVALGYDFPLPARTILIELGSDVTTQIEGATFPPGDAVFQTLFPATPQNPATGLVLVDVHFTGSSPNSGEDSHRLVHQVLGRMPDEQVVAGVDADRTATVWASNTGYSERADVRVAAGATREPVEFARATARALLLAADLYPEATLVVTCKNLKVVNVLAGRFLASALQRPRPPHDASDEIKQRATRLSSSWYRVFERTIFLNTWQEPREETWNAQSMRVHPSQQVLDSGSL